MEITHQHHTHSDDPHMTNLLTFILVSTGLCVHLIAAPGGFYDVLFKLVSCLPVLMAVVINYPKFSARIKSIYKGAKPKRKRTK